MEDIKFIDVEYDGENGIYTLTVPSFSSYRENITVNGHEAQPGESFTTDVRPTIILTIKELSQGGGVEVSSEISIRLFTKEIRQNPHIIPLRHLGKDISSRRGKYDRPKAITEIARNYLNENGFREISGGYGGLTGWSYRLTSASYVDTVSLVIGMNFRKEWSVVTFSDDLKLLHDQYDEDFRNVRAIIDQYMANSLEAFSKQDAIFSLEEMRRKIKLMPVYKKKERDKRDAISYIDDKISEIQQMDDEILLRLQHNSDQVE